MEHQIQEYELSRENMPETLVDDQYYSANDKFVSLALDVMEEIKMVESLVEPFEAEFAKGVANGISLSALAKKMKKSRSTLQRVKDSINVQRLTAFWRHYNNLMDGPNEIQRKQMLWRVAVDNEKEDPKESIKAIAELNKMASPQKSGGDSFNIIINNEVLPRGVLDA